MTLNNSRDYISLEWPEYVLALQSSSKINTITNDPPKRCFPEDTMQIKVQVHLATLDGTGDHFRIVISREQEVESSRISNNQRLSSSSFVYSGHMPSPPSEQSCDPRPPYQKLQ